MEEALEWESIPFQPSLVPHVEQGFREFVSRIQVECHGGSLFLRYDVAVVKGSTPTPTTQLPRTIYQLTRELNLGGYQQHTHTGRRWNRMYSCHVADILHATTQFQESGIYPPYRIFAWHSRRDTTEECIATRDFPSESNGDDRYWWDIPYRMFLFKRCRHGVTTVVARGIANSRKERRGILYYFDVDGLTHKWILRDNEPGMLPMIFLEGSDVANTWPHKARIRCLICSGWLLE